MRHIGKFANKHTMSENIDKQMTTVAEMLEERLALMKSLDGKSLEECRSIADETLEVYAPKAEEIGMHKIQGELQELSMRYGYPDDYRELKRLLQEAEASCHLVFETFKLPICALLEGLGIEFEFQYRMKSVYSIWRKMKKDGKTFDEVYDLFATRIVYKTPEKVEPLTGLGLTDYKLDPEPISPAIFDPEILTCWRVYAAITSIYRVQPDRIKDWITHPKPSGYQALQMTCMGPDCNWIEIQIRSERMNYEAEFGSAAHWKYKASNE